MRCNVSTQHNFGKHVHLKIYAAAAVTFNVLYMSLKLRLFIGFPNLEYFYGLFFVVRIIK